MVAFLPFSYIPQPSSAVFIYTNLVRACRLPETPCRLCCLPQQPLSWSSAWHRGNSDEWEKWTQPGRRWRQWSKPQPNSHPHLLWGQASWRLRSAPPEAPDPGADGCPGGWPWEMKGPLADGRWTLKLTGLVWDAAQLKGAAGAVIKIITPKWALSPVLIAVNLYMEYNEKMFMQFVLAVCPSRLYFTTYQIKEL